MLVFMLLNNPETVSRYSKVALATQGSWVATTTKTVTTCPECYKYDPEDPNPIKILVFHDEPLIEILRIHPYLEYIEPTQTDLLQDPDYVALYNTVINQTKE